MIILYELCIQQLCDSSCSFCFQQKWVTMRGRERRQDGAGCQTASSNLPFWSQKELVNCNPLSFVSFVFWFVRFLQNLRLFCFAQDLGGSLPGDDEPVEFQESLFVSFIPDNHRHNVLLSPCIPIFLAFFVIRYSLIIVCMYVSLCIHVYSSF